MNISVFCVKYWVRYVVCYIAPLISESLHLAINANLIPTTQIGGVPVDQTKVIFCFLYKLTILTLDSEEDYSIDMLAEGGSWMMRVAIVDPLMKNVC